MGKKRKKKTAKKPHIPSGFSEIKANLTEAISRKRGHKALGFAKLLLKHPDYTPQNAPLAAAAYDVRLNELLDQGEKESVTQMLLAIEQGSKAIFSHLAPGTLIRCDLITHSRRILPGCTASPESGRILDEYIRNRLTDLSLLIDYPHLAADNPIKTQARAVMAALLEIENEDPQGAAFEAMCGLINRKSPFAGWRIWLTALAAYYGTDDAKVRLCIGKLKDFPPLKRAAGVLEDLVQGQMPEDDLGSRIFDQTHQGSLYSRLYQIENLLHQRAYKPAEPIIQKMLASPDLADKPSLRLEIGAAIYMRGMTDKKSPYANCTCCSPQPGWLKGTALRRDVKWWIDFRTGELDYLDWEEFQAKNAARLNPTENALIYRHMALICDRDEDSGSLFDLFFEDSNDEPDHEWIKENYFQKSVKARPLRDTYVTWYNSYNGDKNQETRKKAEKLLESWHKDFPGDPQPILNLVDCCRNRNVFQKALGFFKKLPLTAAELPQTKEKRFFLQIENALRHIKNAKYPAARELLTTMPGNPDPYIDMIRLILLWHTSRPGLEAMQADYARQIRDMQRPLSIACIAHLLWRKKIDIHAKVLDLAPIQGVAPDMLIQDFHDLGQVKDRLWKPDFESAYHSCLLEAFDQTDLPSRLLADCIKAFLPEGIYIPPGDFKTFLQHVTARGISRQDALLPLFMAYRSLLYYTARLAFGFQSTDSDLEFERCFAAAYRCLEKHFSQEALHELNRISASSRHKTLKEKAGNLSDRELERILKREAQPDPETEDVFWGKPNRPAKKRKKTKKRKTNNHQHQEELF